MSSTLAAAIQRALVAERQARGITQEQLAAKLGVSRQTVARTEGDIADRDRPLRAYELDDWCAALGCSLLDLFRFARVEDKRRMRISTLYLGDNPPDESGN